MNKTSTRDLIKYAYNETRLNDTVKTRNSIDGDPLVESEFREIVETMRALDELQLSPSDKTVEAILKKAKNISE